jgi:hypothetical protein
MNYVRILILIAIWNLLPSCIPLPSAHRAEIKSLEREIVVGSTTKKEIVSILGKPDLERKRYILYLRREYSAGAYPLSALIYFNFSHLMIQGEEYMDFYFVFDEDETLTDYRMDKYGDSLLTIKDDKDTPKIEKACDPGMESCN